MENAMACRTVTSTPVTCTTAASGVSDQARDASALSPAAALRLSPEALQIYSHIK
jgi:hypothetical protein